MVRGEGNRSHLGEHWARRDYEEQLLPRRQRGNIPGQLLALHVRRRAFAGMQQQAGAGGHAAEECSLALQPLSVSSQHESDWRLLSAAADQAKDCLGDAQVGLKGEWRQK